MSRPKPTVILENINNKTYKSEQVLEADAIWAVFIRVSRSILKVQMP